MATSQAEVSRELRDTIREMVKKGKTNQQIYQYVRKEYGPDQIAIPRQGYFHRISYGLPYVAVGLMVLLTYWIGWRWWIQSEGRETDLDQQDREAMDDISESIDTPLD